MYSFAPCSPGIVSGIHESKEAVGGDLVKTEAAKVKPSDDCGKDQIKESIMDISSEQDDAIGIRSDSEDGDSKNEPTVTDPSKKPDAAGPDRTNNFLNNDMSSDKTMPSASEIKKGSKSEVKSTTFFDMDCEDESEYEPGKSKKSDTDTAVISNGNHVVSDDEDDCLMIDDDPEPDPQSVVKDNNSANATGPNTKQTKPPISTDNGVSNSLSSSAGVSKTVNGNLEAENGKKRSMSSDERNVEPKRPKMDASGDQKQDESKKDEEMKDDVVIEKVVKGRHPATINGVNISSEVGLEELCLFFYVHDM